MESNLENIVAAYARVSTDSENQANSFKNQSDYFENAVDKKENLKFYKLYSDQGLSGVYWKNRDGFNKMLHDAGIDVVTEFDRRSKKNETRYYVSTRAPKFGQIWIKNTARFARNTFSFEIIEKLREKGVYINFITQNIYTKDPSQDFVLKLLMNMDENESRMKSDAVKWGYKRGREHGNLYTHPNIYGFDYIKEENRLIKNKDAETVKKIYDWYTEDGLGIRKIIKKLEEEGIKPALGGKRWGPSSIKNILKNEKYYGGDNGLKYDHGEFGHKTWAHPKENYDVTETERIEPIITKEQFDKAQNIKSERCVNNNNQLKGKRVSYNRFVKKLVCPYCGSNFLHDSDYKDEAKTKKYYYFRCSGKKKLGIKYCSSPNVMEEFLDDMIKDFSYGKINQELERRKANYQYLLLKISYMELDDIMEDADRVSSILKDKIHEKEKQSESYFLKMIENPGLDRHGVFQKMINDINDEIDNLKKELEEISNINKDIYENIFMMLDEYFKIETFNTAEKKRYSEEEVLSMIDTIYVYKSINNPKKPDVMLLFTLYKNATEILKQYEKKYKFKVENITKMRVPSIQAEINTYYDKLKQRLENDYDFM